MARFVAINQVYYNIDGIEKVCAWADGKTQVTLKSGERLETKQERIADEILDLSEVPDSNTTEIVVALNRILLCIDDINQNLARCISRSGEGGFLCVTGNIDTSN